MARALILDPISRRKILQVMDYADERRRSDRAQHNGPPPGDDPNHAVHIPIGYRCVYSVDQGPDGHWYRHLSVSVDGAAKWPNPVVMGELLALFRFRKTDVKQPGLIQWAEAAAEAWNVMEAYE